jgi:zinc resistance-associated protein
MYRKQISIITVVAILAVMALSGSAFARHGDKHHDGEMMPQQMQALTPEQQQQLDTIMEQHFTRMEPLREQMWSKHLELDALASNPNTKPETLSKLVQDITALRAQIKTERDSMCADIVKKVGIPCFGRNHGMYGAPCGYDNGSMRGPGHGGYHDGYGHRGQGNCPGMMMQ